jgi:hypothetical protein
MTSIIHHMENCEIGEASSTNGEMKSGHKIVLEISEGDN